MKILALLSFFNFLAFLYIGLKVYNFNKESALNRTFLALTLCFSIWSGTFSFLQLSSNTSDAFFWHRIGAIGWVPFSSLFLHFTLILSKRKRYLKPFHLVLIYFPGIFFTCAAYAGFMLAKEFKPNGFGWIMTGQRNYTLLVAFTFYYSIYTLFAIFLTYIWYKTAKNIVEKKQGRIVLIASLLTFFVGAFSHLAVVAMNVKVPMPVSFFLLFWVLGVYHALTHYRFLSINTQVAALKILQSMEEAVVLVDTSHKITFANYAFNRMFNTQTQRQSNRDISEVLPIHNFCINYLENNIISQNNIELTFFNSNNEQKNVLASISKVFDKYEQEIGSICIFNDVSQMREFDRNLKTREELYKKIILASPNAIIVTGLDLVIQFVSPIAYQIFKLNKSDDMVGSSIFEWFPENTHLFLHERISKLIHYPNEVLVSDYQLYKKDKSLFWAEIHSVCLLNQNNEPHQIISIVTDISQRKEAHEALKVSEDRMRQIIENSSDISWILGMDFKYIYMSPAIYKFQGYTVEEVMNKHFTELLPEHSIKTIYEAINEGFQQVNMVKNKRLDIRKNLTVEVFHKSGQTLWCQIEAFFKYDNHNNIIGIQGVTRDITAKVKAEEKLKESEEKYRRIFEVSPIGIFSCTYDGYLLEANSTYCKMFGFTTADEMREFLNSDPSKLYVRPEKRNDILGSLNCENLGKLSYENEFYRKDGSIFIGHLRISTIYDRKTKSTIIEGVVEDITERKYAEQKIRASEERFRALTQNSIDMIAIYDENATIKFITPIVKKILGFTHNEIIGMDENLLIHPEDIRMVKTAFQLIIQKPLEIINISYRHLTKDGKYVWLESIGSNHLHTTSINGIVVNTREITTRKEAEKKLIYHKNFEELVSQVSRLFINPGDDFEQNISIMLEKLTRFLDLELANIIFFDDHLTQIIQSISYPNHGKDDWKKENLFQLKNYGKFIDVLYSGDIQVIDLTQTDIFTKADSEILDSHNAKSYVAIPIIIREELAALINILSSREKRIWEPNELKLIQIISEILKNAYERLLIEKQLKQNAEELKNLVETKNTFFSIVAHDIKNPFNSIIGLTRLLVNNYDTYEECERQNMFFHVYDSSEKLYALLENLLYWSRSQSGNINYLPEAINLADVTNETLNLLQYSAEQKEIQLTKSFDDTLFVYADKNMLRTILRNLISNALKFTDSGSITVTAFPKDKFVEITVADTGIGIRQEVINQLFNQDLMNKNKPYSSEGRGTGLGLVLCREFTEKHGGFIKAESEYGKGTRMIFSLPVFDI